MGIRAYKAYYKKSHDISGHAVDRFRERVDAEFQARSNEELANLLDERIVHATDRFPIKDFTKKASREGRIDKVVVRVDNNDGTHCFALVEDKTVVTVLTAQMVDKNLLDGSWEHVLPALPKVNSPFGVLAKIVIPTSDVTVQRRTGVVDVIEQRDQPVVERHFLEEMAPIKYEHDHPIESNLPVEVPEEVMPDPVVVIEPQKPTIEQLARDLQAASEGVTTWSVALQETQRNLNAAMEAFTTARAELNAAILMLSGAPAAATTQIAKTSKPATTSAQRFESKYTLEERARFIELVRNGRQVKDVAIEFNLNYSTLFGWCKRAGLVGPGGSHR